MDEEQTQVSTPVSESTLLKTTTLPTLEVGIGTIVAAVANQISNHPGVRIALTSAAPIIGLGIAFVLRLLASLILREITIMGAKRTYNEIKEELSKTSPDRKARIKELEKQSDEARATLKFLRTAKISLTPS